jgi:hypothetical protein
MPCQHCTVYICTGGALSQNLFNMLYKKKPCTTDYLPVLNSIYFNLSIKFISLLLNFINIIIIIPVPVLCESFTVLTWALLTVIPAFRILWLLLDVDTGNRLYHHISYAQEKSDFPVVAEFISTFVYVCTIANRFSLAHIIT